VNNGYYYSLLPKAKHIPALSLCAYAFLPLSSLVTATAIATRSKEEERMRSPSEIGYMKVLAYGSRTKHSITAESWILN